MSLSRKPRRGLVARTVAAAAGAVGIAAMLAGCAADVVDPAKTEIALRFDVAEATDTKIESVECPSDVEVVPGARFTCTVTARSGVEALAEIEILNEDADLRVVKLVNP